ncbi:hypothetical protein D0Z07_3830 [Hyphodiscus hymeniophilus]|uniref:Uncharacterized protein n=1 Tax=Hyphodiscus hymeniophilus TaxID=353542 RepID=A0A9P6VL05_9HELO|nr:hypothetical protein D0Z07_3830 [Hyphodiscus hymeniophilus]
MQAGTVPLRWKDLDITLKDVDGTQSSPKRTSEEKLEDRRERIQRTKVALLDYSTDAVLGHHINSAPDLSGKLDEAIDDEIRFRLYVVEDLSRDVIEAFGNKLGIEPAFFRAHIVDYAWYNPLDRWRDPPSLDVAVRNQNWMQIRFVRARYFSTRPEFKAASNESHQFNIFRRVDDDRSNTGWLDTEGAVMGLVRSRATIWLQPGRSKGTAGIGVLLLDPTVKSGVPLWRGRRNWYPTPDPAASMTTLLDFVPEPDSFFADFLYWAQHPNVFSPWADTPKSGVCVLQVLLHLICSEWLTMSDLIKTRLNQTDMEILDTKNFAVNKRIDIALQRLHPWRRLLPSYREMISETLLHVFRFPHNVETSPGIVAGNDAVRSKSNSFRTLSSGTTDLATSLTNYEETPEARLSSIDAYRDDFQLVLSYLDEHQKRIDRLTSVVTAVIKIEDTRRSLNDARNIGRLTWLATIFVPFTRCYRNK